MSGGRRGRAGPPKPRIVVPPAMDLLGRPADIGVYLRYAHENVDRSKLLLQRGDLRYALFSANEGLELCVKAYLLHYKAIADPIDAGHFPHTAIIRSIRENAALFGEANPGEAAMMRQTAAYLAELDALFKKLRDRRARVALWKKSLGVDLGGGEQKLLGELGPLATEWSGQGSQAGPGSRRGGQGGESVGLLPPTWGGLRAPLLSLFHQNFEHAGASSTILLLGGGEVPAAEALYFGQLIALTELFLYTTAIVNGSVHQQISRYPTQIDGVDSAEVYARHRDGVERLLGRIYGACEMLMQHLDWRSPPPPPPPPLDGWSPP